MKKLFLLFLLITHAAIAGERVGQGDDRLIGPVKSVFIEMAKMVRLDGTWVEGERFPWLSITYDRSGNKIEESQLYRESALNFRSVFVYDEKGELIEGAEYNAAGGLEFKWSYRHDKNRKRVEEIRYDANTNALFSRSVYLYDAAGSLIEETRYHAPTANDYRWVYSYDGAGNRIGEEFYVVRAHGRENQEAKVRLDSRTAYAYDKGNLIEEARYDASGSLVARKSYSYEFDSRGNWIKQTAHEAAGGAPDPALVTYRTITYYG